MKKLVAIVSILLITILSTGCLPFGGKPSWTLMPPSDGKVYGVGSSPIHFKGVNYQRALAVSMAIDEIARQNGVKVSNTIERVTSVSRGRATSASRNYSVQSVNGQTVNASIKDIWEDKKSHKIYVLMVQD